MPTDRYGLAVSTASDRAVDAYIEAVDLLLSANPGAIEAFERAIAADSGFALAHAGNARALQLRGDVVSARAAMAAGTAVSDGISAREASHMAFHELLLSGQSDAAVSAAKEHLKSWPRDAAVLSPCSSVFGLIGFSGRSGREWEQVALLDSVASAYGDDWWFNAQHAFSLVETGQRDAARLKIERAIVQNPRNANATHIRAHVWYEDGEREASSDYLRTWLSTYSREGQLFGHINWHLALCELEAGNVAEAWRLYSECFAPGVARGQALIPLADGISFLWRAELSGLPRDMDRWRSVHEFAHMTFPRAAVAFADAHVVLADAVVGDAQGLDARLCEMEDMARDGRLASGAVVPALSRAFAAFLRDDYGNVIAAIEPVLDQHERIGGSRAQRDLVEFTLLKAYANAGRVDDVRRMVEQRRPGPRGIPVAGLPMVH